MHYRNHLYTTPPHIENTSLNEMWEVPATVGLLLGSQYLHQKHKEKMAEMESNKKKSKFKSKDKSKKSSIKEEYLDHLYRG